jgi:hypothetical protein
MCMPSALCLQGIDCDNVRYVYHFSVPRSTGEQRHFDYHFVKYSC